MTRKKKGFEFLLDTNWLFQDPIDAEHKEYILLSYFQKLNERFDKYEVYPSFIELSLHFANIQTLIKEGRMMTTEKKFEYCDDELLISDLVTKPIPTLTALLPNIIWLEFLTIAAAPKVAELINPPNPLAAPLR